MTRPIDAEPVAAHVLESRRERQRLTSAAIVLLIIWFVVVVLQSGLIEQLTEPSDDASEGASDEVLEQWRQLIASDDPVESIRDSLEAEVRELLENRIILPKGDTAGMRYPGEMIDTDWASLDHVEAVRRFQAAALSSDIARIEELLEPLMVVQDPFIRFRAILELARAAMRSGNPSVIDATQDRLNEALSIQPSVHPTWQSDIFFIKGFIELERGEILSAKDSLSQAITMDPYNYRAYGLRAAVQAITADSQRRLTAEERPPIVDQALRDIETMIGLDGSASVLRDVARELRLAGATSGPHGKMIVGIVLKAARANQESDMLLDNALRQCTQRHYECDGRTEQRISVIRSLPSGGAPVGNDA